MMKTCQGRVAVARLLDSFVAQLDSDAADAALILVQITERERSSLS